MFCLKMISKIFFIALRVAMVVKGNQIAVTEFDAAFKYKVGHRSIL